MIRKILRPQYTNLTIDLPSDYLNRDIELIIFPIDQQKAKQDVLKKSTKKSLRGVFHQYADKSKIALEENAWQKHIIEKFKENDKN